MPRGPSSNLPAGQDLCDLVIDLRHQRIHVSVSDRRDFYHQIWVTRARAVSNTLGPGLPADLVSDAAAYRQFLLSSSRQKYSRALHGDRLDMHDGQGRRSELLWAGFQSILQGDHGGVEIATDAHSQLLKSYGLLLKDSQLVANRPCINATSCEGLVIDDFFSVSIDDLGVDPLSSRSYKSYMTAQRAYDDYKRCLDHLRRMLKLPMKVKSLEPTSTAVLKQSSRVFALSEPRQGRGWRFLF